MSGYPSPPNRRPPPPDMTHRAFLSQPKPNFSAPSPSSSPSSSSPPSSFPPSSSPPFVRPRRHARSVSLLITTTTHAAMAAASSSRPSGSRKDVFKPRFPLDPFSGAPAAALAEPWFLRVDAVLNATSLLRRNVILVLGAPTLKELAPLLQSRQLSKSLVILATHKPPDIPGLAIPAVRILHLSAPLALEDTGAVRFVTVLEWAERISRAWRKHGGDGVLEFSEAVDINSDLAPPSALRFGTRSTPTSPGSSSSHLSVDSKPSSRPSSIAASFSLKRGQTSLPPPDPSQRPFDAIVNFMPENVPDKSLLKNSILVTTISRPFLTSTVAPVPSRSRTNSSSSATRPRPRSIFNAFSRSSTSVYLPPTPPYQSGDSLSLLHLMPPPPGKALLVHLLPPPHPKAHPSARRKLVDSVESFLVAFAFQEAAAPPLHSQSSSRVSGAGAGPLERARPYVMPAATFCASVGCEPGVVADCGDWTVADVVLSGVLDADQPTTTVPAMSAGTGASAAPALSRRSKRAWISAAADLVIMPAADETAPLVSASASAGAFLGGPGAEGQMQRAWTDSTVSTPPPPARGYEKTRSSSAPMLSSSWNGYSSVPPPVQMQTPQRQVHDQLAQVPPAISRTGKGAYGAASPSSLSSSPGGLPTPPHSEEEGSVDHDAGLDASTTTISQDVSSVETMTTAGTKRSSNRRPATADGTPTRPSSKVAKWKFWRRLTASPGPAAALVA